MVDLMRSRVGDISQFASKESCQKSNKKKSREKQTKKKKNTKTKTINER